MWTSELVWTLQRDDDDDDDDDDDNNNNNNYYYYYTALLTMTVAVILCASKIYWLVQDAILRPHAHKISASIPVSK